MEMEYTLNGQQVHVICQILKSHPYEQVAGIIAHFQQQEQAAKVANPQHKPSAEEGAKTVPLKAKAQTPQL